MTQTFPLVSILIPCHNAEQWIAQAIQSALAQSWPNKEILVVDDGSTDGSLERIRSFGDAIRYETGPNRGANPARNRLLELSSGEWVQYLDADDYLLEHKIASQMAVIGVREGIDAVYSPITLEDWYDGRPSKRTTLPIPEQGDCWVLLATWQMPGTHAFLWRRQTLIDLSGWDPQQPCCQEHELYLRALIAGKQFEFCPALGAIYRQWSEGTLCKKNKAETHRRRLDIEQRIESCLRERNALLPQRLTAINQARFDTARSMWQYDPKSAAELMRRVHESQAGFIPAGTAAPLAYRTAFRWLGFQWSERIADAKRDWSTAIAKLAKAKP